MDLAIAIRIGSPQSSLELVRQTFESIQQNIGRCEYRFIVSTDPKIPDEVKKYLNTLEKRIPDHFEALGEKTLFWSEFINEAAARARDCDFFIKSHDDIRLETPDFFPRFKRTVDALNAPLGWISFDDTGYLHGLWSPPTRPGYFADFKREGAWEKRQMFQFHRFPPDWWKCARIPTQAYRLREKLGRRIPAFAPRKLLLNPPRGPLLERLDIPRTPVRCHAPWNMFVAIERKALEKIGPCEHWQTFNALLVDEDWGLRAMRAGLLNAWFPDLAYFHNRLTVTGGGNRSQEMILKDNARVHSAFRDKWGFDPDPSVEELERLREKNPSDPILWSSGRRSYDWVEIPKKGP
jgi:hypothetical protein